MAKRPIYYDTETTGLKPDKDRIIEIAAYDPTQNKTFQSLINPQCPIPADAISIHNITDEMIQNAPLFKEAATQFLEFCQGDVVLIAHNNDAFDQPFLSYEYKRARLKFFNCPFIDSLKFAKKYRPDLPRYALQSLREYFSFPPNEAHRALDDVMILHQVFSAMIDDLTMEMILEIMNEKKFLHSMPFGKHKGKALKEIPSDYIRWLQKNGAFDRPDNHELKESLLALNLLQHESL